MGPEAREAPLGQEFLPPSYRCSSRSESGRSQARKGKPEQDDPAIGRDSVDFDDRLDFDA